MTHLTIEQALQLAADHHRWGRVAEAEHLYREVLSVNPNHADALNLLGVVAMGAGRCQEAVELIGRALAVQQGSHTIHYNLGCALLACDRLPEAIEQFQLALSIQPDGSQAHNNLGFVLGRVGKVDEAIGHLRRAVELDGNYGEAHWNLADALVLIGKVDESIDHFKAALRQMPGNADLYFRFGTVLASRAHVDEAMACFGRALAIRPDFSQAWNNLGNAYSSLGRIDEAIAAFRRALLPNPLQPDIHSNLLMTLYMDSDRSGRDIYQEHLEFSRLHAEPLYKQIISHTNNAEENRRLKIGYVSGDFCNHPVGRSLINLLPHHNQDAFEVFCYSNTLKADETTVLLQKHSHQWRSILNLPPNQVADMIRADEIDILIDLSLHSGHNQMLTFALKPAPVQVTYLAYAGTSGLRTIDYRLSDRFMDPVDDKDSNVYTEQTCRLNNWCYQPTGRECEVGPLPMDANGSVTFGSLNNFAKVSRRVQETWADLLAAIPGSKLMLHCPAGANRQEVMKVFQSRGVDVNRIKMVGRVPMKEYFAQYHQIDIVLDPFPYSGGTTTCEALYMGCPVITLRGQTAVGRMGVSLLSNLGLLDWIATSHVDYVQLAQRMIADPARLRALRSTLRQRLLDSPICRCAEFVREFENALRDFWKQWCLKHQ